MNSFATGMCMETALHMSKGQVLSVEAERNLLCISLVEVGSTMGMAKQKKLAISLFKKIAQSMMSLEKNELDVEYVQQARQEELGETKKTKKMTQTVPPSEAQQFNVKPIAVAWMTLVKGTRSTRNTDRGLA